MLLPGDGPAPDRLYLLAPTHPLRLLWHLQRANLVTAWLRLAGAHGLRRIGVWALLAAAGPAIVLWGSSMQRLVAETLGIGELRILQ